MQVGTFQSVILRKFRPALTLPHLVRQRMGPDVGFSRLGHAESDSSPRSSDLAMSSAQCLR
jgi:hypothetical protein